MLFTAELPHEAVNKDHDDANINTPAAIRAQTGPVEPTVGPVALYTNNCLR